MSSPSSSDTDDDQSHKEAIDTFMMKKPDYLRHARTLPYELRLLKQRQHNRLDELKKRQLDEIDMRFSVIEMELAKLDELLDEDVAESIRQELVLKLNKSTCRPKEPDALSNDIYPELNTPFMSISTENQESYFTSGWEVNTQPVTNYEEVDEQTTFFYEACSVPASTSAGSSSMWQQPKEQQSIAPTFAKTKEKSPDIEFVDNTDDDDDDEITIVQEIDHRKAPKTAHQRHKGMIELWEKRVSDIRDALKSERPTEQSNTSASRIRNFKILLQYIREIEDLMHKPNTMRDEGHYAQLQARVSNMKLLERCEYQEFNHLDEKNILTLRQADKELAEFQYEWWKSSMDPKK